MFVKQQLQRKTAKELQAMGYRYGVMPPADAKRKTDWMVALLSFTPKALQQMYEKIGIKKPGLACVEAIRQVLIRIGDPTPEQAALIRATLDGHRLEYPNGGKQDELVKLLKAKQLLEEVLELLE